MRVLGTALLAGLGAIGVGLTGAASAQTFHTMTVRLPNGGLAEVRYAGDVPPRVVFQNGPAGLDGWMPVPPLFGPDSPFAMMDRISAEIDRRAAAMFQQAEAVAAQARSGQPIQATFGNLPSGRQGYTFISTMWGNGVCVQSTRIASMGDGKPPRVETSSSGDCAPGSATTTAPVNTGRAGTIPTQLAPAVPSKQPDLILTQNNGATPYAGMIRQVANAR